MLVSTVFVVCALTAAIATADVVQNDAGGLNGFEFAWSTFEDIENLVKSSVRTVATSVGTVTFRKPDRVVGHDIYNGYDADGNLRAILAYNGSAASASFFLEENKVVVSASKGIFTVKTEDDLAPFTCSQSHYDEGERGMHHQGVEDEDNEVTPTVDTTEYIEYAGDGTVLGVRISLPFIRNYRVAFGTHKEYHDYMTSNRGISFTTQLAKVIATMNEYFERDLGVHFVSVGLFLSDKIEPFLNYNPFFNRVVGVDNYDVGIYLDFSRDNAGGLADPNGLFTRGLKAKCFSMLVDTYVTHEMGHMFGASHTHDYGLRKIERNRGYTIMGYGYRKVAFNLGTIMELSRRYEGWRNTQDFFNVDNTNRIPQINTRLTPREYRVPPATPFRLSVEATDPDADDKLSYFIQQLDYDKDLTQKATLYPSIAYMRYIQSGAQISAPSISASGTFYFHDYSSSNETYYLSAEEMTEDTFTYDMFLSAYDRNDEKRNAYYKKFDEIVTNYTEQMIEKRNDKVAWTELNKTLMKKLRSLENPWLPRRDIQHIKVIADKKFTPFNITLNPNKAAYEAGEKVNVSWRYDSSYIPDTDHITIRLSVDSKGTFPYILGRNISVTAGSANVTIPYLTVSLYSFVMKNASHAYLPRGFLLVEHEEGIVFALSHHQPSAEPYIGAEVPAGGFIITSRNTVDEYRLQPSDLMKTVANRTELGEYLRYIDLVKPGQRRGQYESVKASEVWLILANENGTIFMNQKKYMIWQNNDSISEIMKYLSTNRYILMSGRKYEGQASPSDNIHDRRTFTYEGSNHDYVTAPMKIQLRSATSLRPPVPQYQVRVVDGPYLATVIEVSRGCSAQCAECAEERERYIADGVCHLNAARDGSYIAGMCSSGDESLDVMVYQSLDCSGTGETLQYTTSCTEEQP